MVKFLIPLLKFFVEAFGFAKGALDENERTKGLEAQNAILKSEIERSDKTDEIYKQTVGQDETGLPTFNYRNYSD